MKPVIQSLLEQGGNYILLCAHPYNQLALQKREERIRTAISETGFSVQNDQILFWGADQITMWANTHPSVSLWIREKVGIDTFDGLYTWDHWRGRSEHAISFVEDPRLKELCLNFRGTVTGPGGVLRVVGLSGIGKSRLCLEALRGIGNKDGSQHQIRDFVMYTNLSETSVNAIHQTVDRLASSQGRAIIVADNCDAKEHAILTGMISRSGSRLSLLTIDNEIPRQLDSNTIKIDEAPKKVTRDIVRQLAGTIRELDQIRLTKFALGFPAIVTRIYKEYITKQDFVDPLPDDLIREFVCGRKPDNPELLLKAAKLIAAFKVVRVDDPSDEHWDVENSRQMNDLNTIAEFGLQITDRELYAGIKRLVKRGIVKQRGGLTTIEPQPIAVTLAEEQWTEWQKHEWDDILTGDISADLRIFAAQRLALLNCTEIASDVVNHVCRQNGPFDHIKIINHPTDAQVLSSLAEVKPDVVAEQIKRCLDYLDSQELIGESIWGYLVEALGKIAFHSETFKDGARLLLHIETIKLPSWKVDISSPFKELFLLELGGTEADGNTRLQLIDDILDEANKSGNILKLDLIVDALIEGCTTEWFSRNIGPEIQGSQKTLISWFAKSNQEWFQYIAGCIYRIGSLVLRNDSVGDKASLGFAGIISPLIRNGFMEEVRKIIDRVITRGDSQTTVLRQLKAIMVDNSSDIDDEILDWVRSLAKQLETSGLREQARILVTEAPMPEERDSELSSHDWFERRLVKVQSLAEKFLNDLAMLKKTLPDLSRGMQTMAEEFGKSLAEKASQPTKLIEPIVQTIVDSPKDARNYELLSGFISGLQIKYPEEAERFKNGASKSTELAPAIPLICRNTGISSTDIDLIIDAMESGILDPWDLHHLSFTWMLNNVVSTTVAKLVNALIDHSAPSFALAVIILGGVLADENRERNRTGKYILKLSDFCPQLLRLVQNAGRKGELHRVSFPQQNGFGITLDTMEYHLKELVLHILSKGSQDPDARKVALALARTIAYETHDDWFSHWMAKPNSALTKILSYFPEITWPLIGGAIVKNPRIRFRMTYVMGLSYNSRRNQEPAILDLPEDTLFAWCEANPNTAPAFVAECLPVLNLDGNHSDGFRLHSVTVRLIDEFGELKNVQQSLETNIRRYSGISSTAEYYSRFQAPMDSLRNHPKLEVRRWAEKMCGQIKRLVNHAGIREAERELQNRWIGW